jgi:hypothetical protein
MLIENTVMVTTSHSDSAPNASEAATTSINRADATGALWLLKPTARGDRIIAVNPCTHGRITRDLSEFCRNRGQECGRRRGKNGQTTAKVNVLTVLVNQWRSAQAEAAMLAGSSTSSGRQSIETNPGARSTRLSQARIDGNVARS